MYEAHKRTLAKLTLCIDLVSLLIWIFWKSFTWFKMKEIRFKFVCPRPSVLCSAGARVLLYLCLSLYCRYNLLWVNYFLSEEKK